MLYDRHLKSSDTQTNDGRRSNRHQCHGLEVVIAWICPHLATVRYEMLDMSANGLKIRSSSPLIAGMLGRVTRILPHGQCLNETVSIVWTKSSSDGTSIEAGLRFQSPDQ